MILPPDQDEDLKARLEEGKSGFAEITDNLSKINAETAEASVEQDAVTVKSQIRSTVGFDAVNASVKGSMLKWCGNIFQSLIQSWWVEDYLDDLSPDHDEHLKAELAKGTSGFTEI